MSFLSSFYAAASDLASGVGSVITSVTSELPNLDELQGDYGDPSGKKALYQGLDFTYLSPRLIG
jgi:hypothetical protein